MKQLVQNHRNGTLHVTDVPAPAARPGSIVVVTQASLISAGTERATAQMSRKSLLGKAMERPDLVRKVLAQVEKKGVLETARLVFSRLEAPVAPGYSCAGIVLEVGPGVSGIKAGDRVACAGQGHASHAEVIAVPRNLCVRVPDGVELEDASYVALGAIAMQGIRQAEPRLVEVVAVIGLGLLGQLTVQMLMASGCIVVATDLDAGKIELARKFGAAAVLPAQLHDAVASRSGARGADSVIITASTKDDTPVNVAAEICRKRGRVVVVGAVGMNLQREPYYLKEIDLRLSTSYGPGRYDPDYEERGVDYPAAYVRWTEQRNMESFLALLQAGKVDTRALTTHRFAIENAAAAYDLILENTEPYLGVTLDYSGASGPRTARTVVLHRNVAVGKVCLGLIGAGNHVNDMLVPQLRARHDVEIRGVCTGTGIKARALGDKLRAAYCTTDHDAIWSDASINAVLIGTRHDSHARLVVRALEAGKHVFVEKPLCLTEEELAQVLNAYAVAATSGLQLTVGFNRRYSLHAAKIRAAFAGRTGPLVMSYRVNAGAIDARHWVQDSAVGGGRIIGEGCHFVDFMQHVCGSLVSAVRAVSIGRHESGITSDHSIVTLEFTDGSIGTLVYAAGGDSGLAKERFEAFGGGKAIVMNDFLSTEIFSGGRRETFRTGKQDKGFGGEIAAFCDRIVSPEPDPRAIVELEAVTRACCLADRSLSSGERYAVTVSTGVVLV